ncbi:TPA: hypothetical protein ACH3X1_005077 [Trebouxia sp. C0004]
MQAVCCSAPMYTTPLPLGLANITLNITLGVRPFAMRSLCTAHVLVKLQAASSPFAPRLRTQAHTDSQKQHLQRAGHEPVCLVPGSVDKYLHVLECTGQQSLDTHSEGFLSCWYRYKNCFLLRQTFMLYA